MDTLKLDDEIAVKVEVGDKSFVVEDPWDLDAAFTSIRNKAVDENARRRAAAEVPGGPPHEPVMEWDVLDQIIEYVGATYKVELRRGHAVALESLIKKVVTQKKSNWLSSFKLSAS
jgi:hypothetical protein